MTEKTRGQVERFARNQALFREVNERIKDVTDGLGFDELFDPPGSEAIPFVCECSKEDCFENVHLTAGEYEDVRSQPQRFAVVAGHEIEGIEQVVLTSKRYAVVEKLGLAAEVVAHSDSRD